MNSSQRFARENQEYSQETFHDQHDTSGDQFLADGLQQHYEQLQNKLYEEAAQEAGPEFFESNWQKQLQMGNAEGGAATKDTGKSGKQSENSFGSGSFTTGTFNARLAGSHGMAILKYI